MGNELDRLKDEMSRLAEQVAEKFGITLDYSNESIVQVESILGEFHKEFKKTGDAQGLNGVAFEFAAYIVKVVETNVGPIRWERDHPQMGEASFPLYLADDQAAFPFAWCSKRIFDGPEDDVWSKYRVFILKDTAPNNAGKGFLRRLFKR